MTLSVLNIAYPLAPVGPDSAGGAEQVLSQLDRALVQAGHRSLVVACEGSVVHGTLVPIARPPGPWNAEVIAAVHDQMRAAIRIVLTRHRVDVVHLHGIDCWHYLPDTVVPVLVTLHLPPDWYPSELFATPRDNMYLHCVSETQRSRCPRHGNTLPPVSNGVDLDTLRPSERKRNFAIVIGRICPEKGLHHAMDAARWAGMPLLVAGQLFPYDAHVRYFEAEIAPRLDRQCRLIGPVGVRRKQRLLAGARCLLVPSVVSETSSLVSMEALACGTPVIAFCSGALPEIVEDGRTGFVVRNAREMADAISHIGAIHAQDCRNAAERRFSAERMCQCYLARYHDLSQRVAAQRVRLAGVPAKTESAEPATTRSVLREVTTLAELEDLRDAWWTLWNESPSTTPFQSPAWLVPWAKHFHPDRLCTATLSRKARLVGIAPLFVHRTSDNLPKLLFLGTGNTDYLDVLTLPQGSCAIARQLLQFIEESAGLWSDCDLLQIPRTSPLCEVDSPTEWHVDHRPDGACPILELSPGGTLADCLPSGQWRKLAYYRRRIEHLGKVAVERANDSNFPNLFDEWLRLHEARWKARGRSGVMAYPDVRAFHREAAAEMLARDMLRLFVLRLDRRAIASFYGFCDGRRMYYYLGGFEPEMQRLSPGTLMVGYAIEEALRENCLAFDFLRGNEAYKHAWGATDQPTCAFHYKREAALQQA